MKMIVAAITTGILVLVVILAAHKNNAIPANMGVKDGVLAPLPDSPNAVSSQTDQMEKRVDPMPFSGDLEQTRTRIKQAVAEFGAAQILTEKLDYLHVVFTVPIIPFKDDVEFYLSEKDKQVHYRSASRVGYSDLGVNLKRYMRIKTLYEQRTQ